MLSKQGPPRYDRAVTPKVSASRERVLHGLKTRGPSTAASLARRLGVTPTAVRQHLARLAAEGLVAFEDRAGRVGRPRRTWRATAAADACFPERHADLAVGLLDGVRDAFGPAGVDRVVRERTRRQVDAYRAEVSPDRPLEERVHALARLRRDEGYLAAVETAGDGTLRLVENHCPIGSAARACSGLCAGELEVFRAVLGRDATVERTEHLLSGARRCAYRVVPRRPG
jgi:predicted ArsR family transcriptional regulator